MPYTPPCQSPAASPAQSRSASISLHDRPSSVTLTTNAPPRSASYLRHHHRRSSNTSTSRPQLNRQSSPSSRSGSLHQSPAPVNNSSFIPTGAIVSPPDSGSDDESDEPLEVRRGRQIDSKNLDELKEAIKILPQRRVPSPDNSAKRNSPADLASTSPRKLGHNRSTSDSSFLKHFNKSNPDSDVEDDGYRIAPPMVRKKSGELVKSSLKTPNRSRPSSVPSTPTFPKAVHFDSHLEHVRHFLNTEKPTAVSAGSSPVESFDGDEFPFDGEDEYQLSSPFEWEIKLPNFPTDANSRKHLPVRLERAYLSADKQNLLGAVAVHNISFQKRVNIRFTLDYWQTVSEVSAEYNSDVRKKEREENVDRFTFKIKLHDLANLETKTLFFCIRYCVGGQEFWDNNSDMNFQVDFRKRYLPQNGKPGRIALPRSRPAASTLPRKLPSLDKFDDLDDLESLTIQVDKPVPRQSVLISEGTEPVRRANPSGNAFSNRYDFSASLSAAIAGNTSSPRMGVLEKNEPVVSKPEENPYFKFTSGESVPKKSNEIPPPLPVSTPVTQISEVTSSPPPQSPSKTEAGPPEVIVGAEKPSIGSLSYRELLETYCFFGSARGSPQLNQVTLEETPVKDIYHHDPTLLSAYTIRSAVTGSHSPSPPPSLNNSPLLDGQSPRYTPPRYTPPSGSPPSLSGSQRSSATSSPVPFGTYKYQPRRSHGGFAFDTPQATAIRG
ncbi:putative phosphatase regulatory subunit-domain-containing protein [Tirmania nivea]|nr:putative phosphatase regulatory subunit-domain-containing protein [Tirmania nivea]